VGPRHVQDDDENGQADETCGDHDASYDTRINRDAGAAQSRQGFGGDWEMVVARRRRPSFG
jgi:hypothetical protein